MIHFSMGYSLDLRKRIVAACEAGRVAVARRFEVSRLTVIRYVKRDETSSYLDQSREYARAPLAERAVDQAPKGSK
ncbi:MAG: IS630 transposase-related protein [Deinococcota bacterium]